MPDRELRRSKAENARGRLELERVERLSPEERARVREEWWRERRYHVVTPGKELTRAAAFHELIAPGISSRTS